MGSNTEASAVHTTCPQVPPFLPPSYPTSVCYNAIVYHSSATMTRTFQFEVQMTCESCASAVKKALAQMNGLHSVKTSVEEQTVTVIAVEEITMEEVGNKIKSSGKAVKDSRIL